MARLDLTQMPAMHHTDMTQLSHDTVTTSLTSTTLSLPPVRTHADSRASIHPALFDR